MDIKLTETAGRSRSGVPEKIFLGGEDVPLPCVRAVRTGQTARIYSADSAESRDITDELVLRKVSPYAIIILY